MGETKMKTLILQAAALVLPFSLPAAVTCGSTVSGTVTLTSDLMCNSQNGLLVGADNTTIDLNGHTISCAGPGLQGTCQRIISNGQYQPPTTYFGIASSKHSGVHIKGPGRIYGFAIAVGFDGGQDLMVDDVVISGPSQPDGKSNQRLITEGVLLLNVKCAPGSVAPVAVVKNSDISDQSVGVFLQNAECVQVSSNYLHDNNGLSGDAHGIDLLNSRNNTIVRNTIERNGTNRSGATGDAGIQLYNGVNGDTSNNSIVANIVNNNCGDGIVAATGANNNTIERNSVRFNGTSALNGQCLAQLAPTFFDLAERTAGPGNAWNPNNRCRTNSPTIPAGVCGPLE